MLTWSRLRRRRKASCSTSVVSLEQRLLPSAITVTAIARPNGSVNVQIGGTSGDDSISIDPNGAGVVLTTTSPDGFSLNGAAPSATVNLPRLHNVRFDLKSGTDFVMMSDVSANDVTMLDTSATAEPGFYVLRSFLSDVSIGNFRLETTNVDFTMNVEAMKQMRLGNFTEVVSSAQQTRTMISCFQAGTLVISGDLILKSTSSASNDTLEFQSFGYSAVSGRIRIETGVGSDNVLISGINQVNQDVTILTGADRDAVSLKISQYSRNVSVDTGAGDDNVFVDAAGTRSLVSGSAVIQTGTGNDFVRLNNMTVARSLQVNAGQSDAVPNQMGTFDWIWLSNVQVTGASTVRASGTGKITVDSNSGGSLPSRFRSTATFAVGTGTVDIGVDGDTVVLFEGRLTFVGLINPLPVKFGPHAYFNATRRRLVNAFLV